MVRGRQTRWLRITTKNKSETPGLWTGFCQSNRSEWIAGQHSPAPLQSVAGSEAPVCYSRRNCSARGRLDLRERSCRHVKRRQSGSASRQKIRSGFNGQSTKCVKFQRGSDVLLRVIRKWKSRYHENMLLSTADSPGADLKAGALAFLISERRDLIVRNVRFQLKLFHLTAKQLLVVYGEQESDSLCRSELGFDMSSDQASSSLVT